MQQGVALAHSEMSPVAACGGYLTSLPYGLFAQTGDVAPVQLPPTSIEVFQHRGGVKLVPGASQALKDWPEGLHRCEFRIRRGGHGLAPIDKTQALGLCWDSELLHDLV
jgi:hypothetical protein